MNPNEAFQYFVDRTHNSQLMKNGTWGVTFKNIHDDGTHRITFLIHGVETIIEAMRAAKQQMRDATDSGEYSGDNLDYEIVQVKFEWSW